MVVVRYIFPDIHKKLNRYSPRIKQYILSIGLSDDSQKELDGITCMALLRFAIGARTSAYQVFKYLDKNDDEFTVAYKNLRNKSHFLSYRNVNKKIRQLLSLKLIEIAKDKDTKHRAVYFKLTSYGVFYLTWKCPGLLVFHGQKVFENYKNDKLFQLFLYPYLGNSLHKIQSLLIFDEIFNYLSGVCNAIRRDTLTNEILFPWKKILRSDDHNDILLDYLNLVLNLQWLDTETPKIEKRQKENIIKIQGRERLVIIKTDPKDKTKLFVIADGKMIHELTLRENGLFAHKNLSGVVRISEFQFQIMYTGIISRIPSLITSLLFNFKNQTGNKCITNDYVVLAKDENFIQTLKIIKNEIVKHYGKLSRLAKLNVLPSITEIKLHSIDLDRLNISEKERRLSDLELRLDALNP